MLKQGVRWEIYGMLLNLIIVFLKFKIHRNIFGDFYLHFGKVKEGKIISNQTAVPTVDKEHRKNVKANHSATHLLHAALEKH